MADKTSGALSATQQETVEATVEGLYTSEMRVSLVLYGGSSLVVYMNGVAQELLRMVQATSGALVNERAKHAAEAEAARKAKSAATAPNDRADDDAHEPPAFDAPYAGYDIAARISQHDIDTGYADLLYEEPEARHGLRSAAAVLADLRARKSRRRLTIDVLSGASAGALNAIFLARALLLNGDVSEAERLLVDHGDVLRILAAPEPEPPESWPKSLLDGDELYRLMLDGLYKQGAAATRAGTDDGGPLVDALDCYLALTDLRGLPRGDEADVYVVDLDHRASAHLQYGTNESYGAERNDFAGCVNGDSTQPPLEPFLAFVGRATSAHPAAFHPVQLERIGRIVERLEQSGTTAAADDESSPPPRFRTDHKLWSQLIRPDHADATLATRWFSDGGDLDNKPFTHSIEPVESRRATIPVDRKVVWVEPKPGKKGKGWMKEVAPGLTEVTFGAYGLPRKEGTFEDLKKIQERNRVAQLLRQSVDEAIPPDRWGTVDRVSGWAEAEPSTAERRLYEVERARYVVRHLVGWCEEQFVRAGGADHLVDRVRAAVLAEVGPPVEGPPDGGAWSHRQLLVDHDLSYRIRRLNHTDQRLARRQRLFLDPSAESTAWKQLIDWRARFTELYVELKAVDRRLKGENLNETRSVADDFAVPMPEPARITEPERFAADLLENRKAALTTWMGDTSDRGQALLEEISTSSLAPSSDPPTPGTPDQPLANLGAELTKAWMDFDVIDMHLLPRYRDLRGELDAIEAVRFSPNDTEMMGKNPERRLGGIGVHNFGGFFDERWRRNDILWGRLDTAELVVKMLIPVEGLSDGDEGVMRAVQEELIVELQHQILEESADAIAAIGHLVPEAGIAPTDSPAQLRKKLDGLELNLALTGDATRKRNWGRILDAVPTVLGGIVALRKVDPWKGEVTKPEPGTTQPQPDQLRRDMRVRVERVGTTFHGAMQLVAPQTWTPRLIRYFLLPVLALTALAGMVTAYSDDHNDWWWILGGLAIGVVSTFVRSRLITSSGPSWTTKLLAAVGVLAPVLGALTPLIGEWIGLIEDPPDDQERAFISMLMFIASMVGLVSIWLWRSVGRGPRQGAAFVLLSVVGLIGLGLSVGYDVATATQLLGSIMILIVSGGLFAVLHKLQSSVDGFARSSPNATTAEQPPAS